MREHQIIINLKPEHYQELERLSRVAGARSVSIFVKERILASLGIGGAAAGANLAANANLSAVTADIRRLHRDLQVFVAESLSGKDFGYVAPGAEDAELPTASQVTAATYDDEESDALGDNFIDPGELSPDDDISVPKSLRGQDVNPAGAGGAEPSTQGAFNQSGQTANQSSQSSQSNRSAKPGSGSIGPGASSFPVSNFYGQKGSQPNVHFPIQSAPNQSSAPSPSVPAKESIPARDALVPDDLEELAERAFAISPRLGAIDEIDDDTPMFSDPLDELLGELDDDDRADGDSGEQLASQGAQLEVDESDVADDEDESQESGESPDLNDPEEESDNASSQTAIGGGNEEHSTSQVSDQSDEQAQTRPNTSDGSSSQNPPPISGGPPPRRRRT